MTGSAPPDPKAFEVLYRQHYRQVKSTVLSFRLPSGLVDEVIQDAFVTAWQKLGTLEDPNAFKGWLLTITRNRCLAELRRKKPTVAISGGDYFGDGSDAELVLIAEDTDVSYHWEHSVDLVRELIEGHGIEPRATVAKLFYLEDASVKEIATKLALKQNTVLSHLHRFRTLVGQAAKALIEERGLEPIRP